MARERRLPPSGSSFKLERQLDYKPTEDAVIDYAQMILGELEAAVLAMPPLPHAKVAAFQEDNEIPKRKGKSKSKSKAGAKPCWRWSDGSGCRFGLSCSFAHDPLGPGRCWVCGSSEHMKPQCPYAGSGSGPEQAQGGNQPPALSTEDGAKAEDGGNGRKSKKKAKKEAVRKAEEAGKEVELPKEPPEGGRPSLRLLPHRHLRSKSSCRRPRKC